MKKVFLTRVLGLVLSAALVLPQTSVTALAAESEGITEILETVDEELSTEIVEDSEVDESTAELSGDISEDEEIIIEESSEENLEAEVHEEEEEPEASAEEQSFQAETMGTSGKLGTITWSIDNNGTFTLDGSGVMEDVSPLSAPWMDYEKSIKKVVIKGSISAIGQYAFYKCTNLTEVVFESKNLSAIKDQAFNETGIAKITLPESLRSIGNSAFQACKLTEITIPSNVETIGQYAFADNKGLTKVNILSNRITSADIAIFNKCSLSSITFPKNMTAVPDHLFWYATYSAGGCSVTIPATVKRIGENSFCSSIVEDNGELNIKFEEGSVLTTIGDFAFWDTKIYKISLTESLVTIGQSSFSRTKLSEITIPSNVVNIGTDAFEECTGLTEVNIKSKKITGAGYMIFRRCAISKVVFPEGITTIPANLFYEADFDGCKLTIPATVTTIGKNAFSRTGNNPGSISELSFEKGSQLRTIGNNAFYDNKIYDLNLPAKLETIGDYAFYGTLIENLVIPSGVKSIGLCAFDECPNLYRVTIPKSVKKIEYKAFATTDGKTIKCSVPKGSYAYNYVKKYANDFNYVIISTSPIAYVLKGGTNNAKNPVSYEKGERITLYDPSRTGYTFRGWFTNSSFTKSADDVNTSKGGKLTFYAKWEAKTYPVTLDANGKNASVSGSKSFDAVYGKAYPKFDAVASREGYKFAGWYTLPQGGKKVKPGKTAFISENPDEARLYAHWTPVKYKIKYQLEGGKNKKKAATTYTENKECILPVPTRKGYTFDKWVVVSCEGKITLKDNKIPADSGNYGNVVLKAVWIENGLQKNAEEEQKNLQEDAAADVQETQPRTAHATGHRSACEFNITSHGS